MKYFGVTGYKNLKLFSKILVKVHNKTLNIYEFVCNHLKISKNYQQNKKI